MNKWVKYLLWIVGLFVFLGVAGRSETAVDHYVNMTFRSLVGGLIDTGILFFLGIYLSILFLHAPRKMNVPLFVCVFLPTTLFWMYIPIDVFIGLGIPVWMMPLLKLQIFPVISGFSLMLSFFSANK